MLHNNNPGSVKNLSGFIIEEQICDYLKKIPVKKFAPDLSILLSVKPVVMDPTLFYAILFINLACLLYTIGVWAEKLQHKLKWWHTAFFWSGLICDTIGTTAMSLLSGSLFKLTFHGITGNIAILLMLFHAVWATIVLLKNKERLILNFHRFSVLVWIIWLIPMVSGMVFGATR